MKKSMPALFKKGDKGAKGKTPSKARSDEVETMPEGEGAPKRADRPARKAGGAVKKGC